VSGPQTAHDSAAGRDPLAALLAESLALWGVAGRVAPAAGGCRIEVSGGALLLVRPAPERDRPVRWLVSEEAGAAGGVPTPARPCLSVAGLLRTLRRAVAPDLEGQRLRVGGTG